MNLIMDYALHLDKYMPEIIQSYGMWTYMIFYMVVFCETGLVVVPFLPGDSLLFTAGAIAGIGMLEIKWVFITFFAAAILGNLVNYQIGRSIGPKVFNTRERWFFKKENLAKTHAFYERYGAVTLIITRFMPIIRTFTPFVAGVGKMSYTKFLLYNLISGMLWVSIFVLSGYFFGNIPFVKMNFTMFIYLIIVISLMPVIVGLARNMADKTVFNKNR